MPSVYPAGLDAIPLPDLWLAAPTGATGEPARPAGAFLTDVVDSIKAVQQSVGTSDAPGPLLDAVAGGAVFTLVADTSGLTDASPAIQDWADSLAAGNASGYAPPGDYLLLSPITLSGLAMTQMGIHGAGCGITNFIVPASNTTGAFLFDGTGAPRSAQLHLADFTVITRGVGQGTGIKFNMSPGGAQHQHTVVIERVQIHGENTTTHCFDVALDLRDTYQPRLFDVTVTGPWGTGIDSDQTDASPLYTSTAALILNNAYAWHVDSCHFWSAHTGIRNIGTNGEGGRLINSTIVGVRVALERVRTSVEPNLIIHGNHWNYRDTGLNITGGKLIRITNNHPYNQDNGLEFTGVPRDIWIKNMERSIIAGNTFQFPGITNRINVHIDGSTMAKNVLVANNIFGSGGNNAVHVGTLATQVTLLNNQYPGIYTKRVVDNSGVAAILDPYDDVWRVENQGNGAAVGPDFQLYRDSASPAANDLIGRVSLSGNDSAGNLTEYAAVQGQILDPTNASEDGAIRLYAMVAGTLTEVARVAAPSGSGATGLKVIGNRGGTLTIDDVTHGATDTGGAGYKVLRVPN